MLLQPGEVTITPPANVFLPGYNNIDLRYQVQAQSRPQALVRMSQVNNNDKECARSFFNLSYLLQSIESLYPALRGTEEVGPAALGENLHEYDLLYLTGKQALTLNNEFENLKSYLNLGGVLLVDAPLDGNALTDILQYASKRRQFIGLQQEDVLGQW